MASVNKEYEKYYTTTTPYSSFAWCSLRFAETSVQIAQKDLLVYKELLLCLGQGEFPLIENCAISSYLATIVYLENPDAKLYEYITDKELKQKIFNGDFCHVKTERKMITIKSWGVPKNYFIEKKNECIFAQSPSYSFIKVSYKYCDCTQ